MGRRPFHSVVPDEPGTRRCALWPRSEAGQQANARGRHGSSPPLLPLEHGFSSRTSARRGGGPVIRDLFVPTIVPLALAAVSFVVCREGLTSMGFRRSHHPWDMAAQVFGWTAAWTLLQLALVMPVLNHAIGDHQERHLQRGRRKHRRGRTRSRWLARMPQAIPRSRCRTGETP